MNLPQLAPITEELARPFIKEYCDRFNLQYGEDEAREYGKAVIWIGAWYENSLRAVCGLLVADELPDFLFIYGFYGDGSNHQYKPIRALVDFIERMPYSEKAGYIVCTNEKMLKIVKKFGWSITDVKDSALGPESVRVEKVVAK